MQSGNDHPCGGAYETQSERLGYGNARPNVVEPTKLKHTNVEGSDRKLLERIATALERIANKL